MNHSLLKTGLACALTLAAAVSFATGARSDEGHNQGSDLRADAHAPIGVMGDHMHEAGEIMFSLRWMRMNMAGTKDGRDELSNNEVVTTVPNRFFGMPMQPPTLRIVPQTMNMDMIMFGAMYAPTDWVTLMAMGMFVDKRMELLTYRGPVGTTRLGTFETSASGLGDTKLSGLFRLYEDETTHVILNAGLSLPTGSITKEDSILTPMNTRPTVRLPYSMQLGTGTVDFLPGITYRGRAGDIGWGAQAMATLHIGQNSQDYRFGNKFEGTAWASYEVFDALSFSLRMTGKTESRIQGIDSQIVGPVQTANPDYYGGETIELGAGVNTIATEGFLRGNRLAAEFSMPVYRNLNGPQMPVVYMFTLGWQKSF